MPITILAPRQTQQQRPAKHLDEDSDSEAGGADLQGDIRMMGSSGRMRLTEFDDETSVVTPGEVITNEAKWMRGHGTYVIPQSPEIISSVAGTITRTNKLISVRPLRARYTPEIGDLVVGRIVEVQAKRWRVDVGSSQLAVLQISAINLPGGILRKRTETDELQIRSFFSEGDLVVAEVQMLHQDGAASLHTRSLRYGKLRNGVFVAVSGTGGGGGVVRAKRQVWTMEAANNAGKVDVILGVNGYIWICQHAENDAATDQIGLNRMEENVSFNMYSNQNDVISPETMKEIARIRSVILSLVENRLKVDETMVTRGYEEAVEMGGESLEDSFYLGGDRGVRLVASLQA